MKVVINGIGIAGPTLAYWLAAAGHDVLLVEEAPELRRGGYVVDFWGTGYDIAEKMGLLPQIKALGYQVGEVRLVDDRGRPSGGFSTEVITKILNGRFTSVRRSDLSAVLYEALDGAVESRFDDAIESIEQSADHVHVGFRRGEPREVDLVIGADGLHSAVRRIAFGPDAAFERPLGYHVAAFEAIGYRPRDERVYVSHAIPGRQISRFSMRDDSTLVLFIFRDEYLPDQRPGPIRDRKAALAHVFADVGWEWPEIRSAMMAADDLYFDRVSQIRMDRWARGRVALVGDAAACVSLLAGEGTGLGMTEAYTLAAALRQCGGDYQQAFARYQDSLMPLLKRKQQSASTFASSFVPATTAGLVFRNAITRLFGIPFVAHYFLGRDLRDDFPLPAIPSESIGDGDPGPISVRR
jgi:2-polyprenyl-6-methoxyphenol hydroxylase-like FAD-dependent oxidoreductase